MTSDMVALCTGCSAVFPLAGKTEIVCALSSDVIVAEMVIECFWIEKGLSAVLPKTPMRLGWRQS